MSFRLKWLGDKLLRHRDIGRELKHPWHFWAAATAYLVPGLCPSAMTLELRDGGAFEVQHVMTLYVYNEIFVQRCYDEPRVPISNPTIIDIGANTGLFAVRMRQLYPRATVHCYEPVPANHAACVRNLTRIGMSADTVYQEGVGGSARTQRLFMHPRNLGGHSLFSDIAGSSQAIDIQLVDLRTALDRAGGRCHLLKLDCEGAEYDILMSLDADTASRVERIVLEPTPSLYNVKSLWRMLERFGYAVRWHDQGVVTAELRAAGAPG